MESRNDAKIIQHDGHSIGNRIRHNTDFGSLDFSEVLADLVDPQPDMKILDVGCGTGLHLTQFLNTYPVEAYGVDPHTARTDDPRLKFVHAGAEALPFETGTFDRVMSNYALYYVDDRNLERSVDELLRVLRRPGRLVVTGPGPKNNSLLYSMHRELIGPLSVFDVRAPGFVRGRFASELERRGIAYHHAEYWNRVDFGDSAAFLDYYHSTTLFRLAVAEDDRLAASERVKAFAERQIESHGVFRNTKHIDAVYVDADP